MTAYGLTYAERLLAPMDSGAVDYLRAGARERRTMVADARRVQREYRRSVGYTNSAALLTSPDRQAKLAKNETPTYGFMLPPADAINASGLWHGRPLNLCPWASDGCRSACLGEHSGKGRLASVQRARAARAVFMLLHPREAGVIWAAETVALIAVHGAILQRPNITSDIRWERVVPRAMALMVSLGVTFYDYSKAPERSGYDITRSATETMSDRVIVKMARAGHRVAVVFAGTKDDVRRAIAHGATFHGVPVVNGIDTDDRTKDARGVIVALAGLGTADGAGSGFFRPMATLTAYALAA